MKHIAHLVHVELHHLVWPVLFGAAFVMGGCETSSNVSVSPTPDVVKCQVALVSPPMVEAAGGTGTLTVTTQPECAWDASTAVTWISALSPESGQGTSNLEFRVAPNEDLSTRDGDILVNGTAVRVSQRATCRFTLAPASQTISAAGGAASLTVSTGSDCPWTATTDAGWISFTTPSSGSGNGSVGFSVAVNGGDERTGRIAIGGQTATVTQRVIEPCEYSIAPTSQNVGAAGGTGTVTVSSHAGCRWVATSNASWLAITSGSPGDGNGSVGFTASGNTGAARIGTLTIAGRQFTVTQAGTSTTPSCTYSISPTSQSVPATGASGTVSVSAGSGCAWTATSNASWITASASGSGNGSVAFTVAANAGASRTGTITIAARTFSVTQAAVVVPQCQYSVSPNRVNVDASGGTASVAVSTTSGCAWTASSGDSWITIASGASGTGSGTVTFNVARNDGRARDGSLTVAGRNVRVEQRDGRRDEEAD